MDEGRGRGVGRKGRLTVSFLIACKLKYTYSSINIIIKNRRLAPSIFYLSSVSCMQ